MMPVEDAIGRRLAASLRLSHSMTTSDVHRVDAGESTLNFVADTTGEPVFVKVYRRAADLVSEAQAIEVAVFAAAGGVPGAPVIPDSDGRVICRSDDHAYSVWRYIDAPSGAVSGMSETQMAAMGGALGRMHRRLARHPVSLTGPRNAAAHPWDIGQVGAALHHLREVAVTHGDTEFGRWASDAVAQRLAVLPVVAGIAAKLPHLSTQVIHGDLAAPNVLLTRDGIAAIVDYHPPVPQPTAHDISRIGCDPRTVLRLGERWLPALQELIRAYVDEYPTVPLENLTASVRWWVCYTATSTYPIRGLVAGESPVGGALETYARHRHRALLTVLDHFEEVEDGVRATVRSRR